MRKVRINAIEVSVASDLTVSYRLNLPIRAQDTHLFTEGVESFVDRKGVARYQFVFESSNRELVLRYMKRAQLVIADAKISELKAKQDFLTWELAQMS